MLVIRADGNQQIGAGHLMRCLTIADEVAAMGGRVSFCCSDSQSADLVEKRGYPTQILGSDYRYMEEEPAWWEALPEGEEHRILVDSYRAGKPYFRRIRESGRGHKLIRLEDSPHPMEVYPVDMVINYNIFASQETYDRLYEGRETLCCIGGAYVPLREQFTRGKGSKAHIAERDSGIGEYDVRNKAQRILITTGGGDMWNIAGSILEKVYEKGREYVVVSGAFNPHMDSLRDRERCLQGVKIVRNVDNMARLMMESDLAITAGGTTVYELCAVGTPFVAFAYAENQEALAACIEERGCGISGGNYHLDREESLMRIEAAVKRLEEDRRLRSDLSRRQQALVDGRGAVRIGEKILA